MRNTPVVPHQPAKECKILLEALALLRAKPESRTARYIADALLRGKGATLPAAPLEPDYQRYLDNWPLSDATEGRR